MSTHLVAGVSAGIAGLLVFLVIHQFWITPIWFILPLGLLIAAIGGAAVGWTYGELSPSLPSQPWTIPTVIALIGIILTPAFILAESRKPLFITSDTGVELSVSIARAVIIFILELLVTATLTGGIAGWIIGHTPRAALATATAGFVFALGPGHNIPFLGNTHAAWKGFVILLVVVVITAFTLVEMSAILSRKISSRIN